MADETQDEPQYDVIIIGGGGAGLSAAIYSVRAMLKTLVIEKQAVGGQILYTGEIENYPGFPEGIPGPDLAVLYEKQAARFGTEFEYDSVVGLDVAGPLKRVIGEFAEYTAKTVIITSGGEHNKLGVPGEEESIRQGMHTPCGALMSLLTKSCDSRLVKNSFWNRLFVPRTTWPPI